MSPQAILQFPNLFCRSSIVCCNNSNFSFGEIFVASQLNMAIVFVDSLSVFVAGALAINLVAHSIANVVAIELADDVLSHVFKISMGNCKLFLFRSLVHESSWALN